MSRMTTNNDDHSKENGRLSTTSKISSMKFGDGEEESHFNAFARQNSLHETESHLNPRFNDRSEGTTLNHFQTRTSNFSSVPPQINHDLDDAQAIIDKIDQPKELLKAFEAYQPKNKEIDIAAMRKSERTKIKKYKNSVFLGEFLNGKRHGKGILISIPLKVYEGDWENDVKHGKGLEILDKGSRYEGSYSNGKPEGFGTFQWGNGESYEGEWKIGLKHGSGMWKGTKGESYLGEWKYGKAEGYGVHTWRNGDKYEGEFKGFLKHGHGTEKFVNGDYYIGNYVNGKPDGFGEYYWSNGCHYKGDFKNGLRHGKGVWKKGTGNGDFYEGEWANDKKNGTGVYKWASGNRYLGCYFDDIRHGYGEMYWTDGSAYKGFWEKGIQHGEGQLIMPGKGNKRGIFDKNILVNDVETGGTEQDLFNNSHGEDTTVLRESNNRNRGQAATPNRYSQNKPPKRVIPKVNDYNSVTDQNRINESGLPDIRHSVKGTGYSIQLQEKEKRRNSSSVGPKRVLRDSAMGKLEAQNKSGEYGTVKKIPNLNSMSINDNVRRIANIAGTVKAK